MGEDRLAALDDSGVWNRERHSSQSSRLGTGLMGNRRSSSAASRDLLESTCNLSHFFIVAQQDWMMKNHHSFIGEIGDGEADPPARKRREPWMR